MPHLSLVVFVGLPGSGKSTICQKLLGFTKEYDHLSSLAKETLKTAESSTLQHTSNEFVKELANDPLWVDLVRRQCKIKYVHICFDSIIPLKKQETFALLAREFEERRTVLESYENAEVQNTSLWKNARNEIYRKVEELLQCAGSTNLNDKALEELIIKFGFKSNDHQLCPTPPPVSDGSSDGSSELIVILLDDNFYYRSMRQCYHQLAGRHRAGYCSVFMHCDAEEAVRRNNARGCSAVPEAVTLRMAGRLEPPDPAHHRWERNALQLTPGQHCKDALLELVLRSVKNPVDSEEALLVRWSKHEAADVNRVLCSKSVVHQADLLLRSLVSQKIKEEKESSLVQKSFQCEELKSNYCDMKTVAKAANDARQLVLEQLRDGKLLLPEALSAEYSNDMRELLVNVLNKCYGAAFRTLLE